MNLGEVRALLEEHKHLPDDTLVILQKDVAGNGFSPLASLGEAMYLPLNTWSGEVYATPEQIAEEAADPESFYSEEDAPPDGSVRVLLLWPVN